MIYIRSFIFHVYFLTVTLVYSATGLCLFFMPRLFHARTVSFWSRVIAAGASVICGLKYRVIGRENLPTDCPYLVAAKHQSAFETYMFGSIFPKSCFILKQSLAMIPLFGWQILLTGCIPIDRKSGMKAMLKILNHAKNRLENGQTVIIFPEGTRVKPDTTGNYHSGIALLDAQLSAPVIPVALNSGRFWGKNAFLIHPGTVTFKIMPPLPKGLPKKEFLALLKETIETGCREIE